MKSENKNLFTMVNEKGESMDCEVVLTIDSDEFGKSYIVYTDHTLDDMHIIEFEYDDSEFGDFSMLSVDG